MSGPADGVAFGGQNPLVGRLRVPGDKSISHRALLFSGVSHGCCTLEGLGSGGDIVASRAALAALGVSIEDVGDRVVVMGNGFSGLRDPQVTIDCGNSGTTIRLLCGILSGQEFATTLTGDESLCSRPMDRVAAPLREMGATISGRTEKTLAPLTVSGGSLQCIVYNSPVASAQVKTAVLLAGLQASGTTVLREPTRSRDHTEKMLGAFGAPVNVGDGSVSVARGEISAFDLRVAADPSSAAFFVVGAAITPGSDLVLEEVCLNPTRIGFIDALLRMGAEIEIEHVDMRAGEPVGDIHVRYSALVGTTISGAEIPTLIDEIPVLAVAAAFADGVTEIRDAAELLVKESNRIDTSFRELVKLGVDCEPLADGLRIVGGKPHAASLDSHGDHRIAMSMAIAANALADMSRVDGWNATSSSYPEFRAHLSKVTAT